MRADYERRWSWLIRVALNKGRDIHRNRWHRWVPVDPDTLAVDSLVTDEEDNRYTAVHSAIDHLRPDLKELVVYCYLKGHTYSEAVEWFGISLGVVSRRLRQARDLLRSELSALPEFSARSAFM
ncbi:MAG TPA: RNA polymerase sigma factor [Gemmataceae bacterium]|nr:RNA polymerase sigma factor [Gemmataceae bacterium]